MVNQLQDMCVWNIPGAGCLVALRVSSLGIKGHTTTPQNLGTLTMSVICTSDHQYASTLRHLCDFYFVPLVRKALVQDISLLSSEEKL